MIHAILVFVKNFGWILGRVRRRCQGSSFQLAFRMQDYPILVHDVFDFLSIALHWLHFRRAIVLQTLLLEYLSDWHVLAFSAKLRFCAVCLVRVWRCLNALGKLRLDTTHDWSIIIHLAHLMPLQVFLRYQIHSFFDQSIRAACVMNHPSIFDGCFTRSGNRVVQPGSRWLLAFWLLHKGIVV